ncbi:hypothetical protein Tsubulata_025044 [Turnera subulata]|uniref:Uncharacterized protein n=1 Tax=Turnera subulata TaxID=218843 RepID=A0A9Q0G0W4_9ROSI|nr:hypothetical protein Tsubulata_025044 [Turnera subulata]
MTLMGSGLPLSWALLGINIGISYYLSKKKQHDPNPDSLPNASETIAQGSRNYLDNDEPIPKHEKESIKVDDSQISAENKYCSKVKEISDPCFVCGKRPSNRTRNKIWGYLYCKIHESDRTIKCLSCRRLKPNGEKYFKLDDGRNLCPKCFETAVLDSVKLKSIISEVQKFYLEEFDISISLDFPILLLDRKEIKRLHGPPLKGKLLGMMRPVSDSDEVLSVERCVVKDGHIEAQKISWKEYDKSTISNSSIGICLRYGMPE